MTVPWVIVYLKSCHQNHMKVNVYERHMKKVFMLMKLMAIVSIVADKGTHLLAAD